MLKGIDNVKGKEKEIKIIHIGKEDLQLFLFTHDMTVYIENPKDLTKKFLELISNSSKIVGYKVNTQKSIVLLHSSNGKEMTLRIQYYLLCVCVCECVCVRERAHVSRWVVSDSLPPHGLQPSILLCSWNSPSKNTGVGCPHWRQILYHLSH